MAEVARQVDDLHARVAGMERVEHLARTVGAAVVDADHLERAVGRTLEDGKQASEEGLERLALVVNRQHDREERRHRVARSLHGTSGGRIQSARRSVTGMPARAR